MNLKFLNEMKLKTNETNFNLTNTGSLIIEDKNLIIISNELNPKNLTSNQTLCASIIYNQSLNSTGWNQLFIETYSNCTPFIQMWAAGFLESIFTYNDIINFFENVQDNNKHNKENKELLKQFLKEIDINLDNKINNQHFMEQLNETELKYWTQIGLSKAQLLGIFTGFNQISNKKLSLIDFYFINSDGQISELYDLVKLKKENEGNHEKIIQTQIFQNQKKHLNINLLLRESNSKDLKEFWLKKLRKTHCSVFVKPLKNDQNKIYDILISHSTWDDFSAMLRIFKIYSFKFDPTFNLDDHRVSFSSYPGCISSTDDYYIINQNLFVTETTISNLGNYNFQKVLPNSEYIPDFFRIVLANRLSKNSEDWINWFVLRNSGTYGSQWIIIDLNRFNSSLNKEVLENGTLLMMEQIPGTYQYQDLTEHIKNYEYWASYNVPYFKEERAQTGFSQLEQYDESSFSYINNARGLMFQSKNPSVKNLDDLKSLMLYNPWNTTDNYKISSPAEAIGSRYDLGQGYGANFGEIDVKVTNFEKIMKQESDIRSGPSHEQQPIFKWSTSRFQNSHRGLVDEWNFNWMTISPDIIKNTVININN